MKILEGIDDPRPRKETRLRGAKRPSPGKKVARGENKGFWVPYSTCESVVSRDPTSWVVGSSILSRKENMEKCATKWTKREALGEQNTFADGRNDDFPRIPSFSRQVIRIDRRCSQSRV